MNEEFLYQAWYSFWFCCHSVCDSRIGQPIYIVVFREKQNKTHNMVIWNYYFLFLEGKNIMKWNEIYPISSSFSYVFLISYYVFQTKQRRGQNLFHNNMNLYGQQHNTNYIWNTHTGIWKKTKWKMTSETDSTKKNFTLHVFFICKKINPYFRYDMTWHSTKLVNIFLFCFVFFGCLNSTTVTEQTKIII